MSEQNSAASSAQTRPQSPTPWPPTDLAPTSRVVVEISTTDHPARPRPCPVAASLQLLGERWTLLAIREINYGVHRFEQIAGYTGASRDILADRLRKLETAGVIERRQYSEHPPRFEYHLTTAGRELRPVLLALAEWGGKWAQSPPTGVLGHDCGHQLELDHLCRHCGEPATGRTMFLHKSPVPTEA